MKRLYISVYIVRHDTALTSQSCAGAGVFLCVDDAEAKNIAIERMREVYPVDKWRLESLDVSVIPDNLLLTAMNEQLNGGGIQIIEVARGISSEDLQ